jgi:hypothetical protein
MIQEVHTKLPPAEVLEAAKTFFARRTPIYAAFIEKEGANFVTFRGQGGEEIVIGVEPTEQGTLVRGSTYLFDAQVSRFFTTLDPIPMVEDVVG